VIDNVILSDSMNKFCLSASATVRSDVATQVTNYGTTTTDHYPVFTQYSFTPPGSQPTQPPLVFTGVQQGNTALLKWTTTPENDTKLFEVQKSLDGKLFLPIGLVPAKADANTNTNYTFVAPPTVTILPNPAIGFANLIVTHADGPYIIKILDANGTLVKQLSGLPGTPVITVGLIGLRGIYTVKVTTATSAATAKLLVL
jgi:hypothetical protein